MNRAFEQRHGLALGLVIVSLAGASLGLWWTCTRRAAIRFLPGLAGAEWIVYPTLPDADAHWGVELPAVFRTSFELNQVQGRVLLRIAGFHRYALSINGMAVDQPMRVGKNWKDPDEFEVSGWLRSGENGIEVSVHNSNGPPALWLSLEGGALKVRTGGQGWEASYTGASWRSAVVASEPKRPAVGSGTYGGEEPWRSLKKCWPTLLVFALLSAAGYWFMSRKSKVGGLNSELTTQNSQLETQNSDLITHDSDLSSRSTGLRVGDVLPVAVLAVLWLALFANNLGALPPEKVGFDSDSHLAYIRYIQEHKSLPVAGEGWEMFQPPLYYVLAAALLELLSLSVSEPAGVMALRGMGLAIGVAHLLIVWAALRLLFANQRLKAAWGLVMAAALPPMLYLSQYVTNEGLAAAMASACILFTLHILREERVSWKRCAGLGLCVGAALLTKSTVLLIIPVICGALLWKWAQKPSTSLAECAGNIGVILAVCAVVAGWHYGRVWLHFGNPLIGNWDPKAGFTWWQDDGYRTSAYYFRFGSALHHPWYGGFKSFWDGIYSTLWGDGLLGGAVKFSSRAPWNYELMAMGYWLSLLPALAVLAGAILALFKFIRRPSAEWFLLLGFSFLVAVALIYMSLVVPSAGQSKAFYGLPALMPFCALGALGLAFLARRNRYWHFLVWLAFGVWAINSYGSFWVLRSSVAYARTRGQTLAREHRFAEAGEFLKARLKSEPQATELRLLLVYALISTGDLEEAERQIQIAAQQEPEKGEVCVWQTMLFVQRQQFDKAAEAARRSVALVPGNKLPYEQVAALLVEQKRYEEAAAIARQALGIAPFSAALRLALGTALVYTGRESEASAQFQYAYSLSHQSVGRLNRLAWKLATDEDSRERNGAVAVKLSEQACALTEFRTAAYISTLAAAYAEAGRYEEAIRTAQRAKAAALDSGPAGLVEKIRQMMDRFKTGQPYREKATAWN